MNGNNGPRVGIVGCGNISHGHLDNLAALGLAQPWAYADVRLPAADDYLAHYGGRYATDDPGRLFADPEVDVVIIASPDTLHAEQAISALRAGKHVFLEKPIATTVADALRVEQAALASDCRFTLDFKFRWTQAVATARAFVPNPLVLFGQAMGDPEPEGHWRLDPTYSAGVVYDLGPHLFDLMYWLSGESEPIRVYAEGGALMRPGHALVDNLVTTICFANGVRATTAIGNSGASGFASKWLIEAFGGDRSATIYDHVRSVSLRRASGEIVEPAPTGKGARLNDLGSALEAFLRCVIVGGTPAVGAADGVRVTRMLEAALESAGSARAIDLTRRDSWPRRPGR